MKKLNLNKETIAALDSKTMSEIKGGFTYSLSTGHRCRASKGLGMNDPYKCGAAVQRLSSAGKCDLVEAQAEVGQEAPFLSEERMM